MELWGSINIGVYDKTWKLVQRTDYYASGEPWLEPEYGNSAAGNRYLFGGKERMAYGVSSHVSRVRIRP